MTVTVLYLGNFALYRANTLLEEFVFEYEFSVLGSYMVHLRGVEEVGYRHIEYRQDDEAQQYLSQNIVVPNSLRAPRWALYVANILVQSEKLSYNGANLM